MKLIPQDLLTRGYALLDTMDHKDILPFVKKYLNKRTGFSAMYYLSVLVSFALLLFICIKFYRSDNLSIHKMLSPISYGILIAFAIIPFHEWIHALAYKLVGAKQTSFDVNLKKFYFLAIADKFVANKREFQFVALAPFVIISITLIIVFLLTENTVKILLLSALTMHSACCSGDFALLSYFEFNKDKEIVTYDDKENKISYFYTLSTHK